MTIFIEVVTVYINLPEIGVKRPKTLNNVNTNKLIITKLSNMFMQPAKL